MALPRFIVLKATYNKKYLRYLDRDGVDHGYLGFTEEDVISPYAKHQVEMAKCEKGLVNIRCCYNNKFWARASESTEWVSATADKPEEDKSKWSCTLFKVIYVNPDADIIRLRHIQLDHDACESCGYGSWLNAKALGVDISDKRNEFTVIDWESLLILPKHITLKGDNGMYLSSRLIHGDNCLRFDSCDIGDAAVKHTVFTNGDGSISIKSDYFGKYWELDCKNKGVYADAEGTVTDKATYFMPIRVGNNVIALRNLITNDFCNRLVTDSDFDSVLLSSASNINKLARFEVEEAVLSRRIYNISFRLDEARIYNENKVSMASGEAVNMTQDSNTVNLKLSYTETKSSTWNNSVGVNAGVKTTIVTGIPFIFEGKVEVSLEGSYTHEWGGSVTSTNEVETMYTATVPKENTVRVSLMATQGTCDVPFSYTQRDTLFDGRKITYDKDDGLYTGINCYHFNYKSEAEKQSCMTFIK
ncbi:hypothetical protein HS088_TW21G00375 [Tripterygium wilfordii]|uniref:Agglutinin domain-containing protein n=2 Tax=Tripterygium wilfordii TaxID=458696 RepID=A0A7J7C249_TRIWF|nr:hypothetical protein HS088_TW21G00375 [Tripterygium wilfordii]